jgi:hypothetical protein
MKIKDRIVEFKRVKASELIPNPKNWRTHPKEQQDALRGVLADIGIAGVLVARQTPDGLMLIDGHLRTDTAPETLWPVVVLDLNDEEADKLLAVYDPLSAMAGVDTGLLDELLAGVSSSNDALNQLVESLRHQHIPTDEWNESTANGPEIGDYDPDEETFSIRVNHVLVRDKEPIEAAIKALVTEYGYKVEVF